MNIIMRLGNTLVLAVICLALLSGCYTGGHTDPRPGSSQIDIRLPSIQDGNFSSNGTVNLQYATDEDVTFEQVTLCVFTATGELQTSRVIGDLEPRYSSLQFHIDLQEKPGYIFVDHSKFRNHGIAPEIFDWTRDPPLLTNQFPEEYIGEFDYTPPTEPGTCGSTD